MLVLSRKPDQEIHVPEFGIKFRVLGIDANRVRVGIDAPREVRIVRSELEQDNRSHTTQPVDCDSSDADYTWPLGVCFKPEFTATKNWNRNRVVAPMEFVNS